jgi:single-strand DNA-binding protein
MNGYVHVSLIGNVGADPEVRYTGDGKAVASLRVAVNESWRDKNTGEKRERVEWVSVTAFGKLAEIIGEYVRKGSPIFITGKLRTEEYTDKEGVKRWSTKVMADEMRLLGGDRRDGAPREGRRASGPPSETGGAAPGSSMKPQRHQTDGFEDDDIPF